MNKRIAVVLFAVALVAVLAGCNQTAKVDDQVTVTIIGSTSVEKLAITLSDKFADANPNYTFDVQAPGSSAGIKAVVDGTADIGMASRALSADEQNLGLKEHTIALDGIAVVVNPENPVNGLTVEQITDIFSGKITNWQEVGGNDQEILLVSREAGSGTRDAFEELMNLVKDKKSLIAEDRAIFAESTNSVAQNVQDKVEAIGYISLGSLKPDVKALEVDGVPCTVANVQAGTYKVARPFLMVTKGEPNASVQAFLDYIFSDAGQNVVSDEKFIPVK